MREQPLDERLVARERGDDQRRPAEVILGVRVDGGMCEEQLNRPLVAALGGHMQRREAALGPGVDLDRRARQQLHHGLDEALRNPRPSGRSSDCRGCER